MSRKPLLTLLVVVAVVALGVAAWFVFSGPSNSSADAVPDSSAQGVTITSWDKTMGNPKARVTVVEYAAPSCPHCAHFDMDYFSTLKKQYIDTGKIFYVLRVFPLNPADVAAEAIARCLPADSYFQFLDLLWRNQVKWDPEYQVPDVHAGLVDMGRIAGMSAQKVDSCIADQTVAQKATQVGNDATSKYGVNSVPTFIINGQTTAFEGDWDAFRKHLDEAVAKAKKA
ncbi:MAG TPA: thioredoxin domain-containing protein [Rhizomicrobium sp.]|nr:thioredoxin domain-containing protein [Rhizomicrobium sp.]